MCVSVCVCLYYYVLCVWAKHTGIVFQYGHAFYAYHTCIYVLGLFTNLAKHDTVTDSR